MSEKPEALRLADELENGWAGDRPQAAAELRHLHAENERLREALTYDWDQLEACRESLREHMVEIKRLRELLEEVVAADDDPNDKLTYIRYRLLAKIKAALRREDV